MTSTNYNSNIQTSCHIPATIRVPIYHEPEPYRVNLEANQDIWAVLQCKLIQKLTNANVNDFIVSKVLATLQFERIELQTVRENTKYRNEAHRMTEFLDLFCSKEDSVFMEFLTLLVNLPENPNAAAEFRAVINQCFPNSVQKLEENSSVCNVIQSSQVHRVENTLTINVESDNSGLLQNGDCVNVPSAVISHSIPLTVETKELNSVENSETKKDTEVDPPDEETVVMLNDSGGSVREVKTSKRKWSDKKNVLICFLVIVLCVLIGLICTFALKGSSNNNLQSLEIVSTFPTTATPDDSKANNVRIIESEASGEEYRYRFGRENSKRFTISDK